MTLAFLERICIIGWLSNDRARYGWESDFPDFHTTPPATIRERLAGFVRDASEEQRRAWAEGIPPLQVEVGEVLDQDALAKRYSAILEYELPMEARRPDVILLVNAGVLVLELKGKLTPSQADLDQVAAYARDLRCYHRDCAETEVVPIVVPTRARGYLGADSGVHVVGPDALDSLVTRLSHPAPAIAPDRKKFLEESAYRPLPTLVKAARELFQSGELRAIHRARAATEPTVRLISSIVHHAARTKTRHLILVTGVPGAGKTLVGLQVVHSHELDELSVAREGGRPTTPAVFLSGNGPLVDVLQYELKGAGGGGKTFVRRVKDYVERYSSKRSLVPPEHVLVFDEAQRAYDAEKVAATHKGHKHPKSEPEHFIEFAERVPEWCVVIGLIGSGQEIHVGEEAGIIQWRWAIERSTNASDWTVHVPPVVQSKVGSDQLNLRVEESLSLDIELRFHFARRLHEFVAGLVEDTAAATLSTIAAELEQDGFHLRVSRSLEVAKAYLRERYADAPDARFGLVASSKDKSLPKFGIQNDFQSTKRVKFGPWYADGEDAYAGHSCRLFESCVTEFGAQGLELDGTLLGWGTDFRRINGAWSTKDAGGYRNKHLVRDAYQLRVNAYRVLLTRARDVCVAFVPPMPELDETFQHLIASGFKPLEEPTRPNTAPAP